METRLEVHKNILSLISRSFFKKQGGFLCQAVLQHCLIKKTKTTTTKPCACHASAFPEMQMVIEKNPQCEEKAENPTRACKQGVSHDLHNSSTEKLHLQVNRGQGFSLLPWVVPWSHNQLLTLLGHPYKECLWSEQGGKINKDNLQAVWM